MPFSRPLRQSAVSTLDAGGGATLASARVGDHETWVIEGYSWIDEDSSVTTADIQIDPGSGYPPLRRDTGITANSVVWDDLRVSLYAGERLQLVISGGTAADTVRFLCWGQVYRYA